jgi:hypothetical protein
VVSLLRDRAWNHFRKGEVTTKYNVSAEYDIRLYSPLSYTAFGADKSVIGKWHSLAYFIVRVLNNLSGLFNSIYRIKRTVHIDNNKSARTANVNISKKRSKYAKEWLAYRNTRISVLEPFNHLHTYSVSRKNRLRRGAHRRYRSGSTTVTLHKVGFSLCSGASLFSALHRIVRLRKIRRKYKCYYVCKQSSIYNAISCLDVMFIRSVLYILSGVSGLSYLRSILVNVKFWETAHWVTILRYILGCCITHKRIRQNKRKRKHNNKMMQAHTQKNKNNNKNKQKQKHKRISKHTKRKKRIYYVRYNAYRSLSTKIYNRMMCRSHVATLYAWRLFYISSSIMNTATVEVRSSISPITELFWQLYENKAHHLRVTYYRSVLQISLRRALSYSNQILPLQKSFWSPSRLRDFILLLVSLDVDLTRIRYRDVVTILMRGRYKYNALHDDIYKDNNRTKSKSKHRGNVTRYRKTDESLGKIGIMNELFYDLSFFLKLNYDTDLYRFYSFCKLMCSGNMTLGTALWLYELNYSTFFTTYFISAVYSFSAAIYINNACYTSNSDSVMCIGDVIEVRDNSVFIDSFIVICNIIVQCRLSIIKQFWFVSLVSSLRPFLTFQKWIKKKHFFRFPKWNMFDATSHYMIRPYMYYSNSKFRRLGVTSFKRKFVAHYINGLERTLHFFFLYLFKEAHFRWNIAISFTICWRYSIKLRSALYKNYAFIRCSNLENVMCEGILRRIVHLQYKMAKYVFSKMAYCVSSSVQILVNKPSTSKWNVSHAKKDRIYMFSELWRCKLGQAKNWKRTLFGWGEGKPRAFLNNVIEIPTFIYSFYRSEYIKERISFEKDTDDNAWRCANLFTVFFLFFKYGQRSSVFHKAIKQQRRVVKAAAPALRVNLMNARNWVRKYKKRRYKRILKKLRIQKKRHKLHSIIRRKLRSIPTRSKYVNLVDFSDWLHVHGKWPKHACNTWRTPWWYYRVRKKPSWLYNIKKPRNKQQNMPWWSSVRPWRFYATKRIKTRYERNRIWYRNFIMKRQYRWRSIQVFKNRRASHQYIPMTRVLRKIWSKRRKKYRKRYYKYKKIRSKIEWLCSRIQKHYKAYWYRVYRHKHNLDFIPMGRRVISLSIRKALAKKQGGRYSSNRVWKSALKTWVYDKLFKALKYNVAQFADLYSQGMIGNNIRTSSGKRNRRLHISRRNMSVHKRKRSIVKAYHTSSNSGFDDVLFQIVEQVSKEAKVIAQKKERNRIANVNILFHKPSNKSNSKRNSKSKSSFKDNYPSFLQFNKYLNYSALFKLWGVLSNKSYRFRSYIPSKLSMRNKFHINLNSIKYTKKKWRAFGMRGSFYKDSKFLYFFIHKCKLRDAKKKIRLFLYTQLYKHVTLYKSYISRFISSKLFYRLRLKLLKLLISKYKNKRDHFLLSRQIHTIYSERLLSFFNTLGKIHVQYYSQLRPIVKQCISSANYNELMFLGTRLSYKRIKAPNWRYAKYKHSYRSTLLHYFTKNMLLSPDMFTIYSNNVLIFSIRNMKLHLCVDYYGNAINEFLLHKKIDAFFPSDYKYTDFKDVK